MSRKVLIVDDNIINRQVLNKILCDEYEVLEAKNGEEAVNILADKNESISAVLLDIMMPVMDGFEVLKIMKSDENLSKIPVIIETGSTQDGEEVKALAAGANDYVTKPYNPAVVIHRLRNTITLRETAAIVNMAEKDSLTGIYNRDFFCKKADMLIKTAPDGYYDMVCSDIEHFKLVNDLFGEAVGDRLLRHVARGIADRIGDSGICGRIGVDKFAALISHRDRYSDAGFALEEEYVKKFPISIPISIKHGICGVKSSDITASQICNHALTACNSIKGRYGTTFAYYDEPLHNMLLKQQFITDNMQKALKEKQFVVYYQPKISLEDERVVGAEALVRWIHPEKGFMSPGDFIPVFEKNGFITSLDIYVWETACKNISEWIRAGNKPLNVSVNVSRTDVYNPNLPDILEGLLNKYNLSPEVLHLEITESAYTENSQQLIRVVSGLKKKGFIIEMDDFGMGYSSLNMLSDLPINIIKLDMSFIREISNSKKKNILQTIIFLAQQLNLPVVAEGVETIEQVKMLRKMGCGYVQGYYYSKPLPRHDFERRIKELMSTEI